MSKPSNFERFSFANGANAQYVDGLYRDYCNDPSSVDPTWQKFFEGYDFAASLINSGKLSTGASSDEAKVEAFVNAYRRLGYLSADLNPLKEAQGIRDDMKPENHGLNAIDPTTMFHPSNLPLPGPADFATIQKLLTDTYCRKVGADFRDSNDIDAVVWLQNKMETCRNQPTISPELKVRILDKLNEAEGFERFLQDRYLGQKRFSIEGLDAMIPLLDTLSDEAAINGVEELNLGMAHRGRLNVLANFMGKPYEKILKEFEGAEFNPMNIEGDVKYHLGFASEINTASNKKIRLYLSPNPSHLEAVNPVVEGFAAARQRMIASSDKSKILPILVHGDAAMPGQGIVAETLNLAGLTNYTTGGTIHIIVNNQIGFTAIPQETKSCDYASDIVKFIRAPVLHVNADDPEAVIWAAQVAVDYRQKFGKDFVIDLIGYRRHGHNETDEPAFTQPLMYKFIKQHPTVLELYSKKLVGEGVVSEDDIKNKSKDFRQKLQDCLLKVREGKYVYEAKVPEKLKVSLGYKESTYDDIWQPVKTEVAKKDLVSTGKNIISLPKDFTPHPKIVKLFEGRAAMLEGDGAVDWGMAELLAYATIAKDGYSVRLSGQDCGRGTFSHRHAILHDFETNRELNILNQASPKQAHVDVINSPLSEAGVLGFEFGYSVADPNSLVLWEAQFGDFSNGAQIITDQFLVASEAKWKQACNLVLLLPHGYEGQGPEHSSARPERFLQLCGNINIQVANLTTPAQIFHILRRQVTRDFRKPLVIMTPKSLLRHPLAISPLKDFSEKGFSEVIDDAEIKDAKSVKKLVMCSGKIYYELKEAREKNKVAEPIPLVRVEQLYPFPNEKLAEVLKGYPSLKEIVWTQEEPVNMGAWTFMRPRLETIAPGKTITYVGRRGSGSTAEGSLKSHVAEQTRIVQDALGLAHSIKAKTDAAAL